MKRYEPFMEALQKILTDALGFQLTGRQRQLNDARRQTCGFCVVHAGRRQNVARDGKLNGHVKVLVA
jgi:hypothetical protein